jgi:hypothetical protein
MKRHDCGDFLFTADAETIRCTCRRPYRRGGFELGTWIRLCLTFRRIFPAGARPRYVYWYPVRDPHYCGEFLFWAEGQTATCPCGRTFRRGGIEVWTSIKLMATFRLTTSSFISLTSQTVQDACWYATSRRYG